jgi:hypothetical protein
MNQTVTHDVYNPEMTDLMREYNHASNGTAQSLAACCGWPAGTVWAAGPNPRPVDRLHRLDTARARRGGLLTERLGRTAR